MPSVFSVWRMGRTGHVSRREAGVWYSLSPVYQFGELAVYNEIVLANPLITRNWVWQLGRKYLGAMADSWLKQRCDAESRIAAYAAYYECEVRLAPMLLAAGFDGVLFEQNGYLWVLC